MGKQYVVIVQVNILQRSDRMKVLVACEESQRVCIEFRNLGHDSYSCDIEPCSGGHPEWHIQWEENNIYKGFL